MASMHYNWDSETNEWVGQYHFGYAFDANGNQTEEIWYNWDFDTNDWLLSSKEVLYWSE